ncbi:MAG: hypothetical protein M3Q99_16860 [Acidobacteriota bacterium]|nr:hypothetical protein [Acidobacteriota bacterium]
MSDAKIVKPDIVLELTDEQMQQIAPLLEKRRTLNAGMIFGSVGISDEARTIALSYVPQDVAVKIRDLAYQEIGGNNDAVS